MERKKKRLRINVYKYVGERALLHFNIAINLLGH